MVRSIELPSDKEIADNVVKFLEAMERSMDNKAIFADVNPKEKEAFMLSLGKTAVCARNIQRSLR